MPCSVLSAEGSGTEKAQSLLLRGHSLLAMVTREEPPGEERAMQLSQSAEEARLGGNLGRYAIRTSPEKCASARPSAIINSIFL